MLNDIVTYGKTVGMPQNRNLLSQKYQSTALQAIEAIKNINQLPMQSIRNYDLRLKFQKSQTRDRNINEDEHTNLISDSWNDDDEGIDKN